MTKTKKQLRAEAVERLKNCVAARFDAESIVIALASGRHGQNDWSLECDKLIDLLTDDEHDDGTRYRIIRDGVYMPNVKGCELRSTDIVDGVDEPDSREKLEADVRQRSIRPSTQIDCTYNDVLRWLDRQAAITEREMRECIDNQTNDELPEGDALGWLRKWIAGHDPQLRGHGLAGLETIADVIERDYVRREYCSEESARFEGGVITAQAQRIRELTDERDHLRRQVDMLNAQVIELTAERDELLEENDALREWKACYERMRDERDELVKQRNRAESDAKTQRNNYEQVSSARLHWQKKAQKAEAERDELREKLGKALDLAQEIGRLRD